MKRENGDKVEMKEANERNAGPEVVVLDGPARQDLKRKRKDGDEAEMEEGSKSNAGPELVVSDGPAMQVETEGSKADAGPELVVLDGASPEIGKIQQNVLQSCLSETQCDAMDSQRVDTSIPLTNFCLIPTPEIIKVREALNRSCMELKALVNDPLPEALRVSDAARAKIREKSSNKETSAENQNGNDIRTPCQPINAEVIRATTEILNRPINAEASRETMGILNPPIDAEVTRATMEILNPPPDAEVSNSRRVDTSIPSANFCLIPTPEIIEVREALNRSCMELKALVNDPLSEALRVSCAIRAEIREKSLNKGTSAENHNGNDMHPPSQPINAEVIIATAEILNQPINAEVSKETMGILNPPIDAEASRATTKILNPPTDAEISRAATEFLDPPLDAEVSRATTEILNPPIDAEVSRAAMEILKPVPLQVIQNMKTNAEISNHSHHIVAPHRSLMERNSTACTFEWNDSIDGISEEVANSVGKDKLPAESSSRKLASSEIKNVVGRRPLKRWSIEEEGALREGVIKFGDGNWKLILHSKRDLFLDRKLVDLKDKWRNMTKNSEWQGT